MIAVFSYLLQRTFTNRLTRRIARLREPRYLVPFLVSILWFVMMVFRPLLMRGYVRGAGSGMLKPDVRDALVFAGGIVIFVWIALLWILPSKKAALAFSPAELHFLFPAPVTRRQLVQYKLMQAQVGILFGSLVSAFFSGARLLHPDGWARVFAFWLFLAIMHLHGIGASFVRTDLMEAGWSGVRRRLLSIAVILVVVAGVVISARPAWFALGQAVSTLFGPDDDTKMANLGALGQALAKAGKSGIAGVVLWPFLALPRLVLAQTLPEFLRYAAIGGAILLVHYVWVIRADTSFEEASLELSQKVAARRAARLDNMRRGGKLATRAGRFPWKLSPRGRPEIALVWKNLVNLSRVTPFRALFVLGAVLFGALLWGNQRAETHEGPWFLTAFVCALIAGITSVLGAVFLRNDLREDLFRIDSLKTMPLAGHQIVWAEVIGSWSVLAALQWIMIAVGAFALAMSGAKLVDEVPMQWYFAGAAAAVFVLPALTMVATAVQNAVVVVFPAWVQLGNSRARGFEASGQRILTMFGTMFVLSLTALPAAASGGVASWLLAPALGPWCLLPGALIAAGWMVAEVAFACRLLGRLVDRLDPSTAGIEAQEE